MHVQLHELPLPGPDELREEVVETPLFRGRRQRRASDKYFDVVLDRRPP